MCAAVAGARGHRVALLDHLPQAGAKILISGGGRCNFTNEHIAPDRFISANKRFATSALARYTAQDFIALVQKHGIAYHEKTLGQLFCDGSARQVVAMLLVECEAAGVIPAHLASTVIGEITRSGPPSTSKQLDRPASPPRRSILATGGLSIPKLGATDLRPRHRPPASPCR